MRVHFFLCKTYLRFDWRAANFHRGMNVLSFAPHAKDEFCAGEEKTDGRYREREHGDNGF
jgi:hypothetical protein